MLMSLRVWKCSQNDEYGQLERWKMVDVDKGKAVPSESISGAVTCEKAKMLHLISWKITLEGVLKVIRLRPVGAGSIDLRKEMFVYRLNSTVDMYFI